MSSPPRLLALSQGDPAGIGPEILAKLALGPTPAGSPPAAFRPVLVAERIAFAALRPSLPSLPWERLHFLASSPTREALLALPEDAIPVLDPVGERRPLVLGKPGAGEAFGALAALDAAVALTRSGVTEAVVTAPLSKEIVARHRLPGFTGHTEYLASGCGLSEYGRDYLMAFLAPDLQVALLSTHLPLVQAIRRVTPERIGLALDCLSRHVGGRLVVAGLNPHASEGGLLGVEDEEQIAPAVAAARARGLDVHGPESADSLFARARRGEFDWVLALYHDQGLIAVKTAAFGLATNWTLGLPYLRTSVDHGTAFLLAGRGLADERPLAACVETTLALLAGGLPRRRA